MDAGTSKRSSIARDNLAAEAREPPPWSLAIGICLGFGIWDLEFPIKENQNETSIVADDGHHSSGKGRGASA
jgi:hypothetical protein